MRKDMDAQEFIELLSSWTVNNEQGAQLLYGLSHGVALEDIQVQDIDEALEEAHEAIALIINTLFMVEYGKEEVKIYGTYVTPDTFNSLAELRVRVENLMDERT